MTDRRRIHPTLHRDPYAAGVGESPEELYSGTTAAEAIASAVEHHVDDLDCDTDEIPTELTIELYTGAVWCTGPTEDADGCWCQGGHELRPGAWNCGYQWLLVDWATRNHWRMAAGVKE